MSDTNLATDAPVDAPVLNADPAPDPAPDPSPEPAPQPRMIPADVLVREVTPLRAKNRELEAALEEHRRQNRAQQELIEGMRRNGNGDASATGQNGATHAPAPRQSEVSQADIDRRAADLLFQRDAASVNSAGSAAYGNDWNGSVSILGSFGLDTPDFISSIMEVAGRDKTHEVVRAMTADPSIAASMAAMTPARRIAEITRISERMATKAAPAAGDKGAAPAAPAPAPAKTVSQAPRPAPSVQANAGKVVDWWSDKASDAEFSKGWEEKHGRRGRR